MQRILIQLDTDPFPSVFDQVVAVDSSVDKIFSYGGITPDNVVPLVHGAMFTRGPKDLQNTAIFVGGSDADAGQAVLAKVQATFFGPMRVSTMLDCNGCNTTAAAAVYHASQQVSLKGVDALVLGGTGPVGWRAALLLAGEGANVRIGSRTLAKAESACAGIRKAVSGAQVIPCEVHDDALAAAVDGVELILSAGAAGVKFMAGQEWQSIDTLKVAIDLNAVPPAGLEGIDVLDKGIDRQGKVCFGAIGVGGLKMKIHKAALAQLFTTNDQTLDTQEIYALAAKVQ